MTSPPNTEATAERTYGIYGESSSTAVTAQTAYAGQRTELETGWYLLGERVYSPLLRRFLSPDRLSPFDAGGINRYAYCSGDPVNYIDPSGNIRGAIKNVPLKNALARSQAVAPRDASSTPTIAKAHAVATGGTVVEPRRSTLPQNSVFGSVGPGASTMPGDVAIPSSGAAPAGESSQTTVSNDSAARRARSIRVISGADIPANRLRPDRAGSGQVLAQSWIGRPLSKSRNVELWVSDTKVNGTHLVSVFALAQHKGIRKLTLLTGTHGSLEGNWDARTGRRLHPAPRHTAESLETSAAKASEYGLDVDVVDIGGMTRTEVTTLVLNTESSVVVFYFCFSLVDELVMDMLGIRSATVYDGPTQYI